MRGASCVQFLNVLRNPKEKIVALCDVETQYLASLNDSMYFCWDVSKKTNKFLLKYI